MFRKLVTIVVISFVAFNAFFLAGVSMMSYRIFFDFTSKEISEARLTLLNEDVLKVSSFNTSVSEAAVYIASNSSVIQTFSEDIESTYDAIVEQRDLNELVSNMLSLKRDIHAIEIYTDRYKDYPQIQSGAIYTMDAIRREPWFGLFDRMDTGWIPQQESSSGMQLISYVHRLGDNRARTVGYVKVDVSASDLFASVADDELAAHDREPLLLLDAGGRIIARSHSPQTAAALDAIAVSRPSELYDTLNPAYEGFADHHQIVRQGDERYLMLISKPNYERWRLVHLIPIDTLYATTRELGWFVALLGVCGLLVSIPLAYWVSKRLTVPIGRIIQGLRMVEKGRFDVRIAPHRIEEYDTLATAFNYMSEQLDESLRQMKQENRARRDADMRLLQSQIMPHFLYNTLDTIHWKAMDRQADDISMMVSQLGRMFRIGLSGGKKFIPLHDELEHARCYVLIQRACLSRDIRYEVDVTARMKELYVPKIILQPFIENSMRHGYADGRDGPIEINVSAACVAEQGIESLRIEMTDNGCGLPDGWELSEASGIGIRNVQERIRMYCGPGYGVSFSNRPEGGARVRLALPIIRNREELQAWLEKELE